MERLVQILSIILLVLIIYFVMLYQNRNEHFTTTTTTTLPTTTIPETSAIVNPFEFAGGIAIKEVSTGRYLMQNDDGSLTFTGLRLSSEFDPAANKQIDKCKFTITKQGTTDTYKIKAYGQQLGQAGGNDLYLKDSDGGSSTDFLQRVKANGKFDNASIFKFTRTHLNGTTANPHIIATASEGVQLAKNKYTLSKLNAANTAELNLPDVYIEHYVPTYLRTRDGDFNSTIGPNGIGDKQIYNCAKGVGNNNLVTELRVNNSTECSRKCVESGNCNHYVYNYLRPRTKNNCSLFKNCSGRDLVLDYIVRNNNDRGIVMNNAGANFIRSSANQQQQELINSRLQKYDDSMELMGQNIQLMDQIKEKVEEINDMEIRGNTNAYDHVSNYNNVVDSINDPQNIGTLQHNIKNYIQKSTVINLEQQLAELEKLNEIKARTGNLSEEKDINEIKSVQNVNNAESLNVYLPDDIDRSDKSKHEYMVFGNGKCLSFNKDGNKVNEYEFVDCNRRDNKQLFKIDKINGSLAYNNKVASPVNRIDSTKFETLGFYTVSPKGDEKQCMTLNDNGLVIQPCDLNSEQRYHVSDKIVSC